MCRSSEKPCVRAAVYAYQALGLRCKFGRRVRWRDPGGRRGASIYGVTSCISEYNCRDPAVTTASYYETPNAPAGSGRCGSKQVKIIGTCRRDGLVSLSVFGWFGTGQFHCSATS